MIATPNIPSDPPGHYESHNRDLAKKCQSPSVTNPAQLSTDSTIALEDAHASDHTTASKITDIDRRIESPACPFSERVNPSDSPIANLYKWFDDYNAHPEKGLFKYGDCNVCPLIKYSFTSSPETKLTSSN